MDATTVLLVDDEKEFVDTLAERISIRSLSPQVAYSGEQALEMIVDTVPDVMVLDLKMPGMGGTDVLARVKAAYPEVGVIILTGHGDSKDQVLVEGLGASGYFQKPVDIDRLVDKIRVLG
ncbi:MAG: response regulator [Desulfobacteraceae bacterium]|nr:response regulator [Desulfobacteraceae bacterium]